MHLAQSCVGYTIRPDYEALSCFLTPDHATPGVTDVEAAEELLEFAKRFELVDGKSAQKLRLVELNTSDDEELAAAVPG